MKIYTIGFTKTSAENFFDRLKRSKAAKLVDVRLNNVSQLSGFAKRDDLKFFAREICQIPYEHQPKLAPTKKILDEYKKKGGEWSQYEHQFLELMRQRHIEELKPDQVDGSCLLCSEDQPHHCHRRLVAEYLRDKVGRHRDRPSLTPIIFSTSPAPC